MLLCVYISVWMGFLQLYHRKAHRGTLEDIHQDLSTNAVRCMRLFVKDQLKHMHTGSVWSQRCVSNKTALHPHTHTHSYSRSVCVCGKYTTLPCHVSNMRKTKWLQKLVSCQMHTRATTQEVQDKKK